MLLNVLMIPSPSPPEKIDGSDDESYLNSPGSAHSSTTFPWSTIIMHCPSATAITEPCVMMLSDPDLFDERPPTRFSAFATSVSASSASQ